MTNKSEADQVYEQVIGAIKEHYGGQPGLYVHGFGGIAPVQEYFGGTVPETPQGYFYCGTVTNELIPVDLRQLKRQLSWTCFTWD